MALENRDIERIRALIDERVAPIEALRVDWEEVKAGLRDLQVEVAHLVRAVADLTFKIDQLTEQVKELALQQRRFEKRQETFEKRQETFEKRQETFEKRQEEFDRRLVEQGERMDRGFAELRRELAETNARMDRGFAELRKELAETNRRIDDTNQRMERGFAELRKEIGALTDMYGLDLEDVGAYVVPHYLVHEEGFEVEALEPTHLPLDGEEFEIDLYGKASKEGRTWTVIAEVKSRFHIREMRDLIARNRKIAAHLKGDVLQILFPRRIHPEARRMATEAGIILIPWDYQYRKH